MHTAGKNLFWRRYLDLKGIRVLESCRIEMAVGKAGQVHDGTDGNTVSKKYRSEGRPQKISDLQSSDFYLALLAKS